MAEEKEESELEEQLDEPSGSEKPSEAQSTEKSEEASKPEDPEVEEKPAEEEKAEEPKTEEAPVEEAKTEEPAAEQPAEGSQEQASEPAKGDNHMLHNTNLWAILGLIFAFLFPPLGIVFAIIGLKHVKADPSQKGKGLAMAGLIIGIVLTLLYTAIILGYIPGISLF